MGTRLPSPKMFCLWTHQLSTLSPLAHKYPGYVKSQSNLAVVGSTANFGFWPFESPLTVGDRRPCLIE